MPVTRIVKAYCDVCGSTEEAVDLSKLDDKGWRRIAYTTRHSSCSVDCSCWEDIAVCPECVRNFLTWELKART